MYLAVFLFVLLFGTGAAGKKNKGQVGTPKNCAEILEETLDIKKNKEWKKCEKSNKFLTACVPDYNYVPKNIGKAYTDLIICEYLDSGDFAEDWRNDTQKDRKSMIKAYKKTENYTNELEIRAVAAIEDLALSQLLGLLVTLENELQQNYTEKHEHVVERLKQYFQSLENIVKTYLTKVKDVMDIVSLQTSTISPISSSFKWLTNASSEYDTSVEDASSVPDADGWCKHSGKYIDIYDITTPSSMYTFSSLSEAKSKCILQNSTCRGITQEGSNRYTLRKGRVLHSSPSGENTWLYCAPTSENGKTEPGPLYTLTTHSNQYDARPRSEKPYSVHDAQRLYITQSLPPGACSITHIITNNPAGSYWIGAEHLAELSASSGAYWSFVLRMAMCQTNEEVLAFWDNVTFNLTNDEYMLTAEGFRSESMDDVLKLEKTFVGINGQPLDTMCLSDTTEFGMFYSVNKSINCSGSLTFGEMRWHLRRRIRPEREQPCPWVWPIGDVASQMTLYAYIQPGNPGCPLYEEEVGIKPVAMIKSNNNELVAINDNNNELVVVN